MTGAAISAFLDRLITSDEVRMRLDDLISDLKDAVILGAKDTIVTGLSYDSRSTAPGDLFIAVQGVHSDGCKYIKNAVDRGAAAVLTDKALEESVCVPQIMAQDARKAKAHLASVFFRRPSKRLKCIGITGTNGKTTVSYMLKSILEQDGRATGLIGTIDYQIGKKRIPSKNTTPDPIDLQQYLAQMVDENLSAAVMEVSSHALVQERTGCVDFTAGVFTNLTREHLDYHLTMEEYGRAKSLLFESLSKDAAAIINVDDPASKTMIRACKCPVYAFGRREDAQIRAHLRRLDIDGFSMILKAPAGEIDITSRLPGEFNVSNVLAACATAIALGVPLSSIKVGIESIKSIKGRVESIDCGQDFRVFVDYAHTSDALENLLSHLKPLTTGRLITVFGCGGDRDKTKRPIMAETATRLSDHAVITSDNPRTEDPDMIIQDALRGVKKEASYEVEADRKTAIQRAIGMASGGDIVVIAGKGHEDYQILNSGIIEFDDRRVAEEAIWNL